MGLRIARSPSAPQSAWLEGGGIVPVILPPYHRATAWRGWAVNKISVGQTISFAYGFTFGKLRTVIGIAWLPLLIAQVAVFSLYDLTDAGTPTAEQIRANPALGLRGAGIGLLGYAILQIFNAIVAVGMTRHAFGQRAVAPSFYLSVGIDEFRMFAGYVRYFFAMIGVFVITYVILLVLGLVMTFAAAGGPAAAGIVGIVVLIAAIAVYCAAILTLVRMGFLLTPSIVAERGGGIKRSYELTKGNFWRIVGVWAATGAPLVLLFAIAEYAIIAPHVDFAIGPLPKTPDEIQVFAARVDQMMASLQAEMVRQRIPLLVLSYVYGIFASGLFYSAAAFAYRDVANVSRNS